MDWLGSWLKSIILIILLATFVDILLPNQTMQRYVKTVMSLFILLTLLQPLLSLFQKNASIDSMLADAEAMFKGSNDKSVLSAFSPKQGGAADMQTLDSIERQAALLKTRQEQQSQSLAQQQVSELMKRNIEQTTGMMVTNLNVEIAKDMSGQMQISKVYVQASVPSKSTGVKQTTAAPVKPITVEPVKKIDITIEPKSEAVFGGNKDKVDESANGIAGKTTSTVNTQEQTQIKMLLNKDWQVPLERITVEIAASSGKADY
ncbi:stage III sporulation protein AF [Paenibacillus radicis (ex Xue et al. 2023)]|uniref:Stage III sporulation protein AF n=1 Tax=Paenibacillus radicis (ex Xue et al. 2023) TaxID=2972489 RepID=A0ABT1YLB3_9BACL|nr:stage III sporulation protein AF [Paenibacillus radicis (ex Xue et al. 2023)]MCR8633954.1 stage III sporulation protein AF [Paenibacillus radicis (ex Xue et al. 2023)]